MRKQVFTKQDIILAGFELVDKYGLSHLSARNLAEALGSSTAPVYSNFSSMEELEKALVEEAVQRLLQTTKEGLTDHQFLNMGFGVLEFTWQHPRWYEVLFLGKSQKNASGFRIMENLLGEMENMQELAELSKAERTIVLKKMAIFTHGLATEICCGPKGFHPKEEFLLLLDEVGAVILEDAFQRKPRSETVLQILGSLCQTDEGEGPSEKGAP